MNTKKQPSYYAVIPAKVRYDEMLREGAKLMYGEITALSNAKGYCFASNGYFAGLYKKTPQAISKWIKQLEAQGYVIIEYVGEPGAIERRIWIAEAYQHTLIDLSTGVDTLSTGVDTLSTGVEYNNTRVIIQERAHAPRKSSAYLTSEDARRDLKQQFPGINVDHELDKAADWLAANGKRYKDYAAFARNWLRKVTPNPTPPRPTPAPAPPAQPIQRISPEEAAAIRAQLKTA